MKSIILASGSPRRKELLSQIGLEFKVITSNVSEDTLFTSPEDMVKDLAYNKGMAVYQTLSDEEKQNSIVISADTIVYHNGKVLLKPVDERDAFNILKSLSGKKHEVFTGAFIKSGNFSSSFCEKTSVELFDISDEEIRDYIASGEPFDKEGAYGIQGLFARYIKGIEGDYNNVVGLPVGRLYQELKKYDQIYCK